MSTATPSRKAGGGRVAGRRTPLLPPQHGAWAFLALPVVLACTIVPPTWWTALLVVQLAVLMTVPVYFEGYSSFIAPALTLVVGTAVGILWAGAGWRSRQVMTVARVALALVVCTAVVVTGYRALQAPQDLKPRVLVVEEASNGARCVGADSAGVLLMANVLARNIARGCPTIIDFDGMIYTIDDGSNPRDLSSTQRRLTSPAYQQAMRDYFAASDVLIIHRPTADAFDRRTREYLRTRPLLWRQRGMRAFGPPVT